MTQVVAVAGEPVYLPCDIETSGEEDAVLLVLWYKEDLGTPIYRYLLMFIYSMKYKTVQYAYSNWLV